MDGSGGAALWPLLHGGLLVSAGTVGKPVLWFGTAGPVSFRCPPREPCLRRAQGRGVDAGGPDEWWSPVLWRGGDSLQRGALSTHSWERASLGGCVPSRAGTALASVSRGWHRPLQEPAQRLRAGCLEGRGPGLDSQQEAQSSCRTPSPGWEHPSPSGPPPVSHPWGHCPQKGGAGHPGVIPLGGVVLPPAPARSPPSFPQPPGTWFGETSETQALR